MAASRPQKLEDQAATAALYVTKSQKEAHSKDQYPLDGDNKLSSAGAAASLKYASPRDLPSYPITGLVNTDSSAGAAASLANANQKPFEYWKPDPSTSANKAALMAKDFKPAPPWQPETSAVGSKAAALATKDGGHVNVWKPESTEAGNSAAGQAMRAKGLSPKLDYGFTRDGSKKALLAATGAMDGSRKRSGSTPVARSVYPDSENSAANALSAATLANKPLKGSGPSRTVPSTSSSPSRIDAAKIHNAALTNLSREMFTSHPPVAPEVDEKNRQAGLRAAAISMAKQMYDVQQRAIEQARESDRSDSQSAANFLHNRQPSTASADEPPPQYTNLQEAAQKLAAERLAKLHDEHTAYRNYYGTNAAPQSRLSIRNRPRRRASSDGQVDQSDESRSKQIRSEMSLFNQKLTEVDAKKRQNDREFLLAAAQRNVRASMHGIDEKIYAETGKASAAMMDDWEAKANARAKAESDARMTNYGRVDIGGGKYLDQSEIDAIAARRVQPTLDEITKKAESQRARDEQLRREEQERNEIAAAKVADAKERNLKSKEEWKRFRDEEKQEARAKKDEEKVRKAEEKRLRDEEKRKSKGPAVTRENLPENPVSDSEPPAINPSSNLESLSLQGREPISAFSGSVPPKRLSADEPFHRESFPDEGETTKRASTEEIQQTKNIPPEESAEVSSLENTVQSARPLNRDEILSSGEKKENLQTSPSVQRTVSTVDPTLLDPALRGNVVSDTIKSEASPVDDAEPADLTNIEKAGPTTPHVPSTSAGDDLPKEETETSQSVTKAHLDSTPEEQNVSRNEKPLGSSTGIEPRQPMKHQDPLEARIALPKVETTVSSTATPKSPKSESKVSSWLKTKFSRRSSKPAKPEISGPIKSSSSNFVASGTSTASTTEEIERRRDDSSPKDVAKAEVGGPILEEEEGGKASERGSHKALETENPRSRNHSLSLVSSLSDEDTRGRSDQRQEETSSSRGEGEEFEEARDHFDTEGLNPPTALKNFGRGSDSPVRDSRFQEDL